MDEIRSVLLHLDASTGATHRLRAAQSLKGYEQDFLLLAAR